MIESAEQRTSELQRKALAAIEQINQGDLDGGAEICREVLAQDPARIEGIYGLGLVAHLKGDLLEARNHYHHAVSLNEDWTPVQHSLALLDVTEGSMSAAQLRLVEVLEKDSRDLDTRRLLGQILVEAGQYDDGVRLLVSILEEDPNEWQTHFILASLYAEVERTPESKRHLEAVIAANPEHEQARELLDQLNRQG